MEANVFDANTQSTTQQIHNKSDTQIQWVGDAQVTQLKKEATLTMCPMLQKDHNLISHLLVKESDDDNFLFTPYLTKKQKKKLSKTTYNIRSKGESNGGRRWTSISFCVVTHPFFYFYFSSFWFDPLIHNFYFFFNKIFKVGRRG